MSSAYKDIRKILIANRGEIARRIIRTCREMGIRTVAVYSEPDQEAPFVAEADEAVPLPGKRAKDTYLVAENILRIAKETGADAVHPGYGFLAENAKFSEGCNAQGIVFIGPDGAAIRLMGDKIQARSYMRAQGVPVTAGSEKALESEQEAVEVAAAIGYPVMLKASAGGGGIGMELVRDEQQLRARLGIIRQQAQVSFGDSAVFLEKYIEHARHIEVQVAKDVHGDYRHLFERECSVQRRNQKVIEETPSAVLDTGLRGRLMEAALAGICRLPYTGVGTLEFIFDCDTRQFYFMEMNTRLQVEHPVTEAVTGLDLVRMQIEIARGEHLRPAQSAIAQNGYALEMRIYAEDPKSYMPSPGVLTAMRFPQGARLDMAYEEGNRVSPYYDAMVGKIILSGAERREVLARAARFLRGCEIEGIKTNIPLLERIVEDADFAAGNYTTKFLVEKELL